MSRIRTVKPEWWTRGEVLECSLNARLLYIGMNNFADDFGSIEGNPLTIKSLVFPANEVDVIPLLWELCRNDLLIPYANANSHKGKTFYYITTFSEDQRIDKKGKPRGPLFDASLIVPFPFDEDSLSSPAGKGREGRGKGKGIKTSSATEDLLFERFSKIWDRYPEKKGKDDAFRFFKLQVKTDQDYENIQIALDSYIADMGHIRANGHPDRAWQHGSTWFNKRWKDYVDYKRPPAPQKKVGGLPLPDNEPLGHNVLSDKIKEKLEFAEEMLADESWEGAPLNHRWLNLTVGDLVLEYSERFPKGPFMVSFTEQFGILSNLVMNMEAG